MKTDMSRAEFAAFVQSLADGTAIGEEWQNFLSISLGDSIIEGARRNIIQMSGSRAAWSWTAAEKIVLRQISRSVTSAFLP